MKVHQKWLYLVLVWCSYLMFPSGEKISKFMMLGVCVVTMVSINSRKWQKILGSDWSKIWKYFILKNLGKLVGLLLWDTLVRPCGVSVFNRLLLFVGVGEFLVFLIFPVYFWSFAAVFVCVFWWFTTLPTQHNLCACLCACMYLFVCVCVCSFVCVYSFVSMHL